MSILSDLTSVAKLIAATNPTVQLAAAVIRLGEGVKDSFAANDETVAEWSRTRDELEASVNAHADRTADSLG